MSSVSAYSRNLNKNIPSYDHMISWTRESVKLYDTIGIKNANIPTGEGIKEIVFNNQSRSAAIFLSNGTKNTENLNTPGDLDSDRLSQVDKLISDAHASKNDIFNLKEGEEDQQTVNDYFKISKEMKNKQRDNVDNNFEETDKLLSDSRHQSINEEADALLRDSHLSTNVAVNTLQVQAENNGESVESMLHNQPSINIEEVELLPDSYSSINVAVNTSQTVSTNNHISLENEYATDNQESFIQLDSSQSPISLQDNISDEQNSLIITKHEPISTDKSNRELVNEGSSEIRRVKGMPKNFASQDLGKISEMFSQPIDQYFKKEVFEVSMKPEPFPKIMEMVEIKLKADFFHNASEVEYNFLVKELLGTSKMLNLDAPKVVLIARENFIKILRVIEQKEKEIAIDDDEEPSNSSTEIGIHESVQNSSFDIEKDSTLPINNQISNDSGDLISIPSSLREKKNQSSIIFEITKRDEMQGLETNTQESIQHADTLSDEYSNTDEENDELNFDAALTLMHEAKETSKFTDWYQFKINAKFKAAKKDERFNKNSSSNKKEKERMEYTISELSDADPDKYKSISSNTNIAAEESQASGRLQNSNKMMNLSQTSNDLEFGEENEYEHTNTNQDVDVREVNVFSISSDLTEDSLTSVDEILKLSITQSDNPSKKMNPDIINAKSIVESNRNNVFSISSIINNQQEIYTSNINEQNL
ncbi:26619_t:CDS:10 [Racocetra persica]|uniref:26619_t:CDS:1 n=1 Tax=Racocetra persica TaxID=160502 RepID=A0ACA9K8X6_9GLOM|nr:26619_t:CDS:10 [Racocetra persica]